MAILPAIVLGAILHSTGARYRDTTIVFLPSSGSSSRFSIDGQDIFLTTMCTLSHPGPNGCFVTVGGRSVANLPWSSNRVFAYSTCSGSCQAMPGAAESWYGVGFHHRAGWRVKGDASDWLLEFDSLEFLPGSMRIAVRARWTPIAPGGRWAVWTDSVVTPVARLSGQPRTIASPKAVAPHLRWLDSVPGKMDDLRCRILDSAGRSWSWIANGQGEPLATLLWHERDSSGGRFGGSLSWQDRGVVGPVRESGASADVPAGSVTIPVGSIWDLETSLSWFGGLSGSVATAPVPDSGSVSARGWRRVSAVWSWSIDGVRDSLVAEGWAPSTIAVSVARPSRPRLRPEAGSTDALGRVLSEGARGPLRGAFGIGAP